jgi:phage tail sheath protein FI
MRDDMGASQVIRQVPSSVVALGAFSTNDRIAYPWFAPAGFARGSLSTSTTAAVQLGRDGLDSLYQANINPIVSFQGSNGLIIWGQKTLYAQQSSLDRVNVRRLLLSLRRQVRQVAMRILFEQTLPATLARFSQLVNPILQKVQSQNGLDRYLVQIDATTTTQADFENKTIRGKIFIQPTKVLEYLSVDFVINNPNNFGQG